MPKVWCVSAEWSAESSAEHRTVRPGVQLHGVGRFAASLAVADLISPTTFGPGVGRLLSVAARAGLLPLGHTQPHFEHFPIQSVPTLPSPSRW